MINLWREFRSPYKGAIIGFAYSLIITILGIIFLIYASLKYGEILYVEFITALGFVSFPFGYLLESLINLIVDKYYDGNIARLFSFNFSTLFYIFLIFILNILIGMCIDFLIKKLRHNK